MDKNKENIGKGKTGKAKLELTARITLEDGTVVEEKVSADELPADEIDFFSIDGFRNTFDGYETKLIAARDELTKGLSEKYMEELSKKRKGRGAQRKTGCRLRVGTVQGHPLRRCHFAFEAHRACDQPSADERNTSSRPTHQFPQFRGHGQHVPSF